MPAVVRGRRWHAARGRSERRHTPVPHGVAGLRGAALARLRQGPAHQADHARARLGARRGAPTAVAGGSCSSVASAPCGPFAWPGADAWPCERRRRSSSSTTRRSTLKRRQRHANAAAGLRPHGRQSAQHCGEVGVPHDDGHEQGGGRRHGRCRIQCPPSRRGAAAGDGGGGRGVYLLLTSRSMCVCAFHERYSALCALGRHAPEKEKTKIPHM